MPRGKPAVGPEQDLHLEASVSGSVQRCGQPPHAQPARGIHAGAPQVRRQQMPAAEDVERQIAVAVVVAVKEAAFLMAVHGIIGGIQIQDDPRRRPWVRLQEQCLQIAPRSAPDRDQSCDSAGGKNQSLLGRMLQPDSVDLPATGAHSLRRAFSLPARTPKIGSCRSLSWSLRSRWPSAIANHPLPDQRCVVCSMLSGSRPSLSRPQTVPSDLIALSVAPNSNAPASELITPPSKAPTTERPSTVPKSGESYIHSVARGFPPARAKSLRAKQLSLISSPDALTHLEKLQASRRGRPGAVTVGGSVQSFSHIDFG